MKNGRARWIWPAAVAMAAVQLTILAGVLLPRWSVGIAWNNWYDPTVVAVRPDMPAARAGVRAGDRLELDESSRSLLRAMASGTLEQRSSYTIVVRRGPQRLAPITIVPGMYPAIRFYSKIRLLNFFVVSATFVLGVMIAAWLFNLRPSRMTLAFFAAMSAQFFYAQFGLREFPGSIRLHVEALLSGVQVSSNFALLLFALRFPFDTLSNRGIYAQRIVLLVATAATLLAFAQIEGIGSTLSPWISGVVSSVKAWGEIAALGTTLVILLSRLKTAEAAARARLRWGLVGVSAALTPSFLTATIGELYHPNWDGFELLVILSNAAFLALPLSIAYVLTRSRFVDPRFTINRAAILSVTGAFLILAVAAVDWLSSKVIAQRSASDALDATFAIALGFFVNAIHRRIESIVERFVFRSKHRAESRLREIGEALRFATSEEIVFDALVYEAFGHMHLASAALFVREKNGFRRTRDRGWGEEAAANLDDNDQLVRMIRSHRSFVALDEWRVAGEALPKGLQRPRIALPVFQDEEIVGIAFYSDHADHTKLDPSEIDMLQMLAERSSAALDRIESARLRRRLMEVGDLRLQSPQRLSPA